MSGQGKRLLVVAFHYPPDNTSTGVLRTLKFTQYLPLHGWKCDVLSVPQELYSGIDHALEQEIPNDTKVYRVRAVDAKERFGLWGRYPSFLSIPDRYWSWIGPGTRKALEIIEERGTSAIFTTYPVPSALLIGLRLKKRTGLPWIADFRDPWVEDSMPWFRRYVEGLMERSVLRQADAVICNTPRMRNWFLERYPDIPDERFITIPNGFDEREIQSIEPEAIEKFEILYGGVITNGNRNPSPLFAGLRLALDRGWIDEKEVQITFLGAGPHCQSEEFLADVRRYGMEGIVQATPERIPYQDALNRAAGADVMLVLSEPPGDDPQSRAEREWSHLQVPVKVYEALAMGQQVLALVSGGAVKDLLEQTGSGISASPRDPERIAQAIRSLYQEYRQGRQRDKNRIDSKISRYSRKNLAKELAQVLDLVTAQSKTADRG